MNAMQVRPLAAGDFEAVQAIDRDAHGEAWSHAALTAQVAERRFRHLVAVDRAGQIIGHAATWLDDSTLRVTTVATAATARGQGVASQLLVELIAHEEPVYDRIVLEVRPANRGAQRLYLRFGFAPAGIVRNFYDRSDSNGSRDAIVMTVAEPGPAWLRRIDSIRQDLERTRTDRLGAPA